MRYSAFTNQSFAHGAYPTSSLVTQLPRWSLTDPPATLLDEDDGGMLAFGMGQT
jgi:hypothetical protein